MAILKKMDYLVSESSTNTIGNQHTGVLTDLNKRQTNTTNQISSGGYKTYYYGMLFDTRDKKQYYLFSDVAKSEFSLSKNVIELGSATPTESQVINVINDLTKGATTTYSSNKIEELLATKADKDGIVTIAEYESDFVTLDFAKSL